MTVEELDRLAGGCPAALGMTETARARIPPAVSFLKSDPAAFALFSDLADALRDIYDMKRLLGADNEMYRAVAEPASDRGLDAFSGLMRMGNNKKDLAIAMGDLVMAYANRQVKTS